MKPYIYKFWHEPTKAEKEEHINKYKEQIIKELGYFVHDDLKIEPTINQGNTWILEMTYKSKK